MTSNKSPSIAILASLSLFAFHANSAVISTFDNDLDGWSVADLIQPLNDVPTITGTYTPIFVAGGGTFGGTIQLHDPSSNAWFFQAPSKFLGDQSLSLHGQLSWSLRCDEATDPTETAEQVILSNGTTTLYYNSSGPGPANTWRLYIIDLYGPSFRVGSKTGPAATDAQLLAVLSNLTSLNILGDWGSEETSRLDDVQLLAPSTNAPPAISIAMYPGITINGLVGATYRVEYTNDLEVPSWTPLGTVVLPSTPFLYTDSTGAHLPRRFYRVIEMR